MMDINELYENFEFFDSWEEKYQYIIEFGRNLEALPDEYKTDVWKVQGCQSQVWLVPEIKNGIFHFRGDSDAILVKGIITIVLLIYNDKSAEEIKSIDVLKIFAKLGLEENLSPSRRNGMMSMVRKIRDYADNA